MSITKLSKHHLSLAGEFRVCSELLKLGIDASVTYGNMKACDLLAMGCNRRLAIIEVKTSHSKRFVTGFYQKYKTVDQLHPDFWVLYSLSTAARTESFYVLTHKDMEIAQAEVNKHADLSYEERVQRVAKGVDCVVATDEFAKKYGGK